MIPLDKVNQLLERFEFLEAKMSEGGGVDDFTALTKEYSSLEPVVAQAREYLQIIEDIAEAEEMLSDPEMKSFAQEELQELKIKLPEAESAMQIALLPKDAADDKSAILEIRAGTGGDEAALFAGDLFRMYQRYVENNGWRLEVMEENSAAVGGYKEIIAAIKGSGVFAKLKFESGVHRVQRVPETESGGRIHTSAATVAVLPEAEDIDVDLRNEDLRIDTMRASGAGGQHVNTTDSAVRMTHIPTGIVVLCSEKSQHQNRARALEIMRAKLFDLKRQEIDSARAADRKGQVGSGDRSERIRTYNFPQGRMTDHRINLTLYRLDQIIQGELDEVVDALSAADQVAKLAEMAL